jgi:hypothetical protein
MHSRFDIPPVEEGPKSAGNSNAPVPYIPKGNNPVHLFNAGINYDDYLVGNGFIERGTASLLAGPSGIGKSSIAIQKSILWGIGRPAFNLSPSKALRIVLTQTEDSANDIVKQLAIIDALGLSASEKKLLSINVWVEPMRGYTGVKAIKAWRDLCTWHKADLLMVNPLSAYYDGDISSNEDNQKFLYQQLGAMLTEMRIGFDSIHHKTKPPIGQKRDLAYHEKMYDMLGGSVLTNFHRAIILVDPIGESEVYEFTLAKRFNESEWSTHTQMYKWHQDKAKRLWIPASHAEAQAARPSNVSRADLYKLVPVTGSISKKVLEDTARKGKFTERSFDATLDDCISDLTPDNERLYEWSIKNSAGGAKKHISRFPQS